MIQTAFEGYFLMIFFLLHLSVLTCDEACILPVSVLTNVLPKIASEFAMHVAKAFALNLPTAQLIGQLMLIGDLFVGILLLAKLFSCLIKKFFLMFLSLALSIYLLQLLNFIWMIIIDLLNKLNKLSLFVSSSGLSLEPILFYNIFALINLQLPSSIYVIDELKAKTHHNFG